MLKSKTLIDVHHHAFLPEMVAEAKRSGMQVAEWNIDYDREVMERLGVTGALLSLPAPSPAKIVRQINIFMGEICAKDPNHYGLLASLPCLSVDDALNEIAYAYDDLNADGFILLSNYNGVYLGDERMEEILAELNRRAAVVFVHPGKPAGDNLPLFGRDIAVYEFPFDTTRSIMDLVYKGKIEKYPNIRWIIAHAGGTIPYLAHRLSIAKEWNGITQSPAEVLAPLSTLYYELALSASPYSIPALKKLAGASHVLFGTDFPMRLEKGIAQSVTDIADNLGLEEDEQHMIAAETALKLFPRFVKN
ncbi:MAG: amidohydrolase [Dehalobacter sp. 4CP]|uniref:amidohydrolase family protein n=1 Tax=Dehalobacter sp. CP TaxID=2594474 RepID=UPI0013CBB3FC|nr:amidohydrolase [Dehalobacter sp.]NBJ15928.1 amidohydrolase [Dehalobacter sp. 4CP]